MMSKANRFGTAASLIAMTAVISACADRAASAEAISSSGGGDDIGLASKAALALAAKDLPNAILSPSGRSPALRTTPGSGRCSAMPISRPGVSSAEMAYKDALSIYSEQPQVVLKLALAQIALGKNGEAARHARMPIASLSAADYGLALALAGKPADAVDVLQAAARETAPMPGSARTSPSLMR